MEWTLFLINAEKEDVCTFLEYRFVPIYNHTNLFIRVRATSVIFLLGVGSFACYKLYENYMRKSEGKSDRSSGISPKRQRLFKWISEEELLDADDDYDNQVKGSYFGPEDPSDDPYYSSSGEWADAEDPFGALSSLHRTRDACNSSNKKRCRRDEMGNLPSNNYRVAYRSGNNVEIETRRSKKDSSRSSSSSSSSSSYSGKSHNREIPTRALRVRRNNPKDRGPVDIRQVADGSENVDQHDNVSSGALLESLSSTQSYVGTECDNSLNDEEKTLVSGSLKGNFSPTSLILRNYRADFRDRPPPDGEELSELDSRLEEPSQYNDDEVFDESFVEDISAGSSISRLIREMSASSDVSELEIISWDLPLPEEVVKGGVSCFERLEVELHDIKKDCLSMDACMDAYRQPPNKAYFELVKTSQSDLDDSDSTQSSAMKDIASRHRQRAAFKGLVLERSEGGGSAATSTPSLEWDSMRFISQSTHVDKRQDRKSSSCKSCVTANVDSGSDFGTPLTNESPEFHPKKSNSCTSLEWDDEHGGSHETSLACVPEMGLVVLVDEPKPGYADGGKLATVVGNKLNDWLLDKQSAEESVEATCVIKSEHAWSSQESSGFLEGNTESNYYSGCTSKQMSPEHEVWAQTSGDQIIDSAYYEGKNLTEKSRMLNVGHPMDVVQYGLCEWRGHTPQAVRMREGYCKIPQDVGYANIRRIRGDNYCAVRSTLFQVLSQGIELAAPSGGIPRLKVKLQQLFTEHAYLSRWNFAGRLTSKNILPEMERCLCELNEVSAALRSTGAEQEVVAALFNSVPDLEISLLEAVKIIMMISACELHQAMMEDRSVPVFAFLLFARETSETPEEFLKNHLNHVGDQAGLEQVDMFLLGYAVGVVLKVVRPSRVSSEDFICYFPDDSIDSLPQVCLVAEDDRHYNVLVK